MGTGQRGRLAHVQGVRGVAMLVIVAFHCDLPPGGGFVALDAFFVVSGFVIAGLLLRELGATGGVRFGEFYLRRIRRLLPALALMLVVVSLASVLVESPFLTQRSTGRVGLYATVSLANLALYRTNVSYFDPAADAIALRHTWSLSVEEQFYLLLPALLLLLWRLGRRRTPVLVAGVAVMSVLSFAVLVVLAYAPSLPLVRDPQSAAYYWPFGRLWEMGAGVLLALWTLHRPPLPGRASAAVGWAGALLCLGAVVGFTAAGESSSPAIVVPVLGTTMVLVACRVPGRLSRGLSWGPVCWVGDRSYGWYLWHWPLIVFARHWWPDSRVALVVAAVVALGVSAVTYRLVEQRFRYPRPDRTPSQQRRAGVRIAVVSIGVSLVCSGALLTGARHDWGRADWRRMEAQLQPRPFLSGQNGCDLAGSSGSEPPSACLLAQGSGRPVYLVGDSNGGQLLAGLGLAGQRLDRPVVALWMPGCPFIDRTVERPSWDPEPCDEHNRQVLAFLSRATPGTVVVASSAEYVDARDVRVSRPGTSPATTPAAKAAAWTDGLAGTVADLRPLHDVVIVQTLPHPGGVLPDSSARVSPLECGVVELLARDDCAVTVSLAEEDARQGRQLAALSDAAGAAGVRLVDLRADVCPGDACSARRGEAWVYRDSEHLTEQRSAQLADRWVAVLGGG